MAADLRERVARGMCRCERGDEANWLSYTGLADAVLAELKQELAPQAEPVAYANQESIMLLREVTKNLEAVLWDRPHGDNQMALYATPQPQGEPVGHLYRDHHGAMQFQWTSISGEGLVDGTKLYAAPQPQASADDVGLISEVLSFTLMDGTWHRPKVSEIESAWQRIRADYERMGVVK